MLSIDEFKKDLDELNDEGLTYTIEDYIEMYNKNPNDEDFYRKACLDIVQLTKNYKDPVWLEQKRLENKESHKKIQLEKLERKKKEQQLLPEYCEGGFFCSKEFEKIEAEVDEKIRQEKIKYGIAPDEYHLGDCHSNWYQFQRILKEDYGIKWLTPTERDKILGIKRFYD